MGKVLLYLWMSINAKNVATEIANRTEMKLRQNREEYFAGEHTQARKQAALNRFDEIWEEFLGPDGCGSVLLRGYGQRCIQERMPGGKHDWQVWYLHPIKDSVTPVIITPGGGGFGAVTDRSNH